MPYTPDFTKMRNDLYEESNKILTEALNYYIDGIVSHAGDQRARPDIALDVCADLPFLVNRFAKDGEVEITLFDGNTISSVLMPPLKRGGPIDMMSLTPHDIARACDSMRVAAQRTLDKQMPKL